MAKIEEVKTVQNSVTIGYKCDICGKEHIGSFPNDWHQFGHHHSDWGNDSGDSSEYFYVCSVPCFANQLEKSLDEMEGHKQTAEIADMNYEFAQKLYNAMVC